MLKLRSLFGKMMISYAIALIVLIVMINLMLSQVLLSKEVETNFESMELIGSEISVSFASFYEKGNSSSVKNDVNERAEAFDSDVIIMDRFGTVWCNAACGESLAEYRERFADKFIEMHEETMQGKNASYAMYENNIYYTPVLVYAMPLKIENDTVGSIIVTKRLNGFEDTMKQIYMRFALSSFMSIVIAAVFVYFTARQTERPLHEIDTAAKELSRGNFSGRVSIDDSGSMAVTELAETFNTMADQLEKYEKTRSSFVANVSHELRSPLTSVHGFIEGILDGTIKPEESNQYLEIALHETERMTALIYDLMELAKAESGQFPLNLTEYDINEQIRTTIINYINRIEEKKIDLTVDIPDDKTMVVADMDRIAQVLTNLMDNAVKFADVEGQLKIWTYISAGKVCVNILNTGTVISKEDIPFIFDRFFKADKSHNRKTPGTGIGLSLVSNILKRHGEEISVNSDKAKGTVFTFTLALAS